MPGLFTLSDMILHSLRFFPVLALLSMIAGSAVATAQQPADPTREAIGNIAVDYWPLRLNIYKGAIDRIISADDLVALDRLRVRWGILVAEQAEARNARSSNGAADGTDGTVDLQAGISRGNEILTIMEQAQQIARRYPAGMDEVANLVVEDVVAFIGRLPRETEERLRSSGADMSSATILAGQRTLEGMEMTVASEKGKAGLRMVYDMAFEPIVLLYNGSDLREMIAETGNSVGIDGTTLPASSLLSQNFPNPASSTTTIDYTLRESTSATSIRIYNATGTLILTLDEGSRPAGRHSRMIDVSQLPSGSYLYQLVIGTDQGEQIFAKVMKVVR